MSSGGVNFYSLLTNGQNYQHISGDSDDRNNESLQQLYHQGGSVVNQRSSEETGLNENEFWFRPRTGFIDWRTVKKIKTKEMIVDGATELLPYQIEN